MAGRAYEGRAVAAKREPTRVRIQTPTPPTKLTGRGLAVTRGRGKKVGLKRRLYEGGPTTQKSRMYEGPRVRPAVKAKASNPVSEVLNAIGRGAVGAQRTMQGSLAANRSAASKIALPKFNVPDWTQGILQGKKSPVQKVLERH